MSPPGTLHPTASSSRDSGGSVHTVQGSVEASKLGRTLVHEHLSIDMRGAYGGGEERSLSIDTLGEARRDFSRFPEALVLDDPDLLANELDAFVGSGGRTIVDLTSIGLRGQGYPRSLARLSDRTGVHIVTGTGYYVANSHPGHVADESVEELSERMLLELGEGIDGTTVRAGVIGEIGLSQPVHPDEWKVLEAACVAQVRSGVPLFIHPYYGGRSRVAPSATRFALRSGVDPSKLVLCHMDGYMNLRYQRRVADLGVNIAFDGFGLELYYDFDDFNHNTHDSVREQHLVELLELGYGNQILISHDVATKLQLKRYGGFGYGHILRHIVPSLEHRGVPRSTLDALLIDNPRRLLAS